MTDFSYQLYSSRNFGPLAETLSMLAEAGYASVEGYGALYASLDDAGLKAFADGLSSSGLTMPTAHIGIDLIEEYPGKVLTIAEALGIENVYAPHLAPAERPVSSTGWIEFGERLKKAGAPLQEAGLGFGWHNHAFEFELLADDKVPLEHILDTAPDLTWEADIAWVARGGADPFAWIEKYKDRLTAVHVKDIAPEGEKQDEDGWADLGDGVLPWADLMAALKATPAKYFVMEHDNPSDDKRFATRSIAAAQKL